MEVHLHSQRMQPLLAKGNNPMVGAAVAIAVDIASVDLQHFTESHHF